MVECKICNKQFDRTSQLAGHMRMHGPSKGELPSRKSVLTEENSYKCLNCQVVCKKASNKYNKYCSNKCQQEFQYVNIQIPLILEGKKTWESIPLKRYILDICNHKCTECGIGEVWNDKPLTLQLDHIDGDSDNNFPNNLRILCPNCHTQTDNYGSKGVGSRYKKNSKRNNYLRKYKGD